MKSFTKIGVSAVLSMGLFAGAVDAAMWDLESDFSTATATSSGINGVWKFEYKDSDDANDGNATNVFTSSTNLGGDFGGDGSAPNNAWANGSAPGGGGDHPSVARNETRNDVGVDLNDIVGHTTSGGSHALKIVDITWVAPFNAVIDITGNIWGARSSATTSRNHDYAWLHDAFVLGSGTWNNNSGKASKVAFSTTGLAVTAGDEIILRVSHGSADNPDIFGVDFTVTQVPEPASLVLGCGLAGATMLRRRR